MPATRPIRVGRSAMKKLQDGFDLDLYQAVCRRSELPKRGKAQVNDPAFARYQPFVRPTVGDRYDYGARRPVCGIESDLQLRAQRVEPGSGGELVRVKALAVGHELPAVFFAVPGR